MLRLIQVVSALSLLIVIAGECYGFLTMANKDAGFFLGTTLVLIFFVSMVMPEMGNG